MIHPETQSRPRNSGLQTKTNRHAARPLSRMRCCSRGAALVLAVVATLHFGAGTASGQGLGLNNATPHASSILDLKADNRGLLIPRMLEAEKNAIASPATALLVFQTDGTAGFYFYSGSAWVSLSSETSGWGVSGNAGTSSGTNFLGTTDAQDLDIRTNDVIRHRFTQQGQIEFLNTGNSVFIGEGAGANDDLSVNQNVFVGHLAGNANTTGFWNTAYGSYALLNNTTGNYNTAIGNQALANTTGISNTAIGNQALLNNTTGNYNTANGYHALFYNTTGARNTANGYQSLWYNKAGSYGTAIGNSAMSRVDSSSTPFTNTNVAVGAYSMYGSIDPADNTGLGNTALGYQSLKNYTSGGNNTALGYLAGDINTTGTSNTFVGYNADAATNALSNATAIGANATVDADNTIQLGDGSVTSVNTSGALTTGAVTYPNTDGSPNQVLTTDGAGTLTFQTPATATTYWSLSGNDLSPTSNAYAVGIGTASPGAKFHVSGTGDPALFERTGSVNDNRLRIAMTSQALAGASNTTANKTINFVASGVPGHTGDMAFSANADNTNTGDIQLMITNAGNVGIGTNAPSTKLQVLSDDANQSSAVNVLSIDHSYNGGNGANGIGARIRLRAEGTGGTMHNIGFITGALSNASSTATVREAHMAFDTYDDGYGHERFRVYGAEEAGIARISWTYNTASTISASTTLGALEFYGKDQNAAGVGASITAHAPSAWGGGTNDYPTELQFYTTPDGTGTGLSQRMVIDEDGNVGIGTISPDAHLEVVSTSTSSPRGILNTQYDNGTSAPQIWMRKARGTESSPSSVIQSDVLGNLVFAGYGTSFDDGPRIRGFANQTWTGTAHGSYLIFETVADGSTSQSERMRIAADGKVSLTSGTEINEFSTDGALGDNSDDALPTEQAVKTYVDAQVSTINTTIGSISIDDLTDGSDGLGTQNVFLGSSSGAANVSGGNYNVGLGVNSLTSLTTGDYNASLGWSSLYSNTIGSGNIASGYYSLYANTTGSYNVSSGYYSMRYATTDNDYNIALGYNAMRGTAAYTNADYNLAVGRDALYSIDGTTGGADYNVALGRSSLYSNTTGSWNIASGGYSLYANTTGGNNVSSGHYSMRYATTGNDNNVALGYHAMRGTAAYTNADYNVAVGDRALYSIDGTTTGADQNVALGMSSLYSNTSGSGNTASGGYSLYANTTGGNNVSSGYYSMRYATTGNDYNVALGYHAMRGTAAYTNADYNVAVGDRALYSIDGTTTGADQNVALGRSSLYSNTTGSGNSAMGYYSLYDNTSGNYNTSSGYVALGDNTIGNYNSAYGYQSLRENTEGLGNSGFGYRTLYNNLTGDYNAALGYQAGYNVVGNKNVFLGYQAGYSETGSEKLYIDNSSTTTPLIYGEFDNDELTVNGKLGIGTSDFSWNSGMCRMVVQYDGDVAALFKGRVVIDDALEGAGLILSGFDQSITGGDIAVPDGEALSVGHETCTSGCNGGYTQRWKMGSDGYVTFYNGHGNSSDKRFKTNIKDISNPLDNLIKLRGVNYNFIDKYETENIRLDFDENTPQFGFIAQELELIFPELVHTDDLDFKSVEYDKLIPLIVESIKEQQTIIDSQKEEINVLHAQMTEIQQTLRARGSE